jgi:hypothetical protein
MILVSSRMPVFDYFSSYGHTPQSQKINLEELPPFSNVTSVTSSNHGLGIDPRSGCADCGGWVWGVHYAEQVSAAFTEQYGC